MILDMATPHSPEEMSDELKAKLRESIRYLQSFAPPDDKYWMAFSGGKDSIVLKKVADLAGVDYEAHYSVTSVDPPELMRHIRKHYPDVQWDYPRDKEGRRISMWTLIAEHTLPPTRMVRYCCSALKESSGKGRVTLTGVRWDESANRAAIHGVVDFQNKPVRTRAMAEKLEAEFELNKHGSVILNNDNDGSRRMVEQCYRTRKTLVNPIVKWTDRDVWDFIFAYGIPYCELYDEGFTRLGCIGCPLSGRRNMERDFARWPRYKELYIRAFEKMIDNHPGQIKILDPEYAAAYPLEAEEDERKIIQIMSNGGGYGAGTISAPGVAQMASPRSEIETRNVCTPSISGTVIPDNSSGGGVSGERPRRNGCCGTWASGCGSDYEWKRDAMILPCESSSTGWTSESSVKPIGGRGDMLRYGCDGGWISKRIAAEIQFRRWLRVVF